MKAFAIAKYILGAIGLSMLIGAYLLYQNTNNFLETALTTEGRVVVLVSSQSDDGSVMYSPLVEFTSGNGDTITLSSSYSSNPPAYSVGETVEVFYQKNRPEGGKIGGFFSLWGLPSILGGLGFVLSLISAGIFTAQWRKAEKIADLQVSGISIKAKVQGIAPNTSTSVNGRHPYVIYAQWQNPATSEMHLFNSDDIWFDPTGFVTSEEINVLVDRNDPSKYYMDTSFLPKLAE